MQRALLMSSITLFSSSLIERDHERLSSYSGDQTARDPFRL